MNMERVLQTFVVFLSILASIVSEHGTQNAVRTPCDHKNGGCSSTCFVSTNEQGYSCACPPGIPLLSDKMTCAHEGHAFLLVANDTNILKISLDDSNYTVEELQLDGIDGVVDVDFDPLEGKIYWIESNGGVIRKAYLNGSNGRVIRRAYLNGSGQQHIVSSDLSFPTGIAIDSIARKLYWTDDKRIEMSDLNGTNRKVIMRDETVGPFAIVLDKRSRRIYWTNLAKQRIESSSLDGTNRSVVIELNEGKPLSLALDDERRIIYWGYFNMKKIEMASVDGSNRRVLISNDKLYINGLTVLGDYIYWIDPWKNVIERADKKTGDNRQVIADNLHNPWILKSIIVRNIKVLHPPFLWVYFANFNRINADDGRVMIPKKTLFKIGCWSPEGRQLKLIERNTVSLLKQILKVNFTSEDMFSSVKVIDSVREKTEATVECVNSKGISTKFDVVIADACEVDENELNRRGLQVVPDSRKRIYVEGDRIQVECSSNEQRTDQFIIICKSGREWEYANNMLC